MLLMVVFVLALMVPTLLALTIIALVKVRYLTKKYNAFMKGSNGISLESSIFTRLKEIDSLKEESKCTYEKLEGIYKSLNYSYQKIGILYLFWIFY